MSPRFQIHILFEGINIMFNALSVVKFAVSGVVGIGTSKIVGQILKTHVTAETLIDKVTITAAAWVIGGIACKATKTYADDTIDDVVATATHYVDEFKLGSKLARINREESTFEEEGLDKNFFVKNPGGKWMTGTAKTTLKEATIKPEFHEEDNPTDS